MKNLYITDLDGTLLNKDGQLSKESKDQLIILLNKGVNITVASARSVESIRKILDGLPIDLPIISFNGAYLSDFNTGKHYITHPIRNNSLFDLLKTYGALVSLHKENVDELYQVGNLSEGAKAYIADRERDYSTKVNTIKELPKEHDVMGYTVIGEKEDILALKKKLEDFEGIVVDAWLDMYYKPWYWLSIHSKEATKANGIKSLKKYVETDCVIVFGDNTNDIEMFKYADRGIAVENAVLSLKVCADELIGNHESNSVVFKIAELEKS